MGWDGNGNYTRVHNFSADASAGIKILASRMDAEINDVASAFSRVWTRDGQNTPTQNIPMGGKTFVNVGAATSVNNFMRVREFIENVPIFMTDAETSADRISVSAQYFTSASANQAPGDGTKILVRAGSNKSSAALYLNGHSANVEYQDGTRIAGAMISGGIYEVIFSSVDTAWKIQNPDDGRTPAEISAGVTPTSYQYAVSEGYDVRRTNTIADGATANATAFQNAVDACTGILWLPKQSGAYMLGSEITIPDGLEIWCEPGTVITASALNYDLFKCEGRFKIVGATLTRAAAAQNTSWKAINLDGGAYSIAANSRLIVQDCVITGFDLGVYADGGSTRKVDYAEVSGSRIVINTSGTGGAGSVRPTVNLNQCVIVSIKRNYLDASDSANSVNNIYCIGSSRVDVSENTLRYGYAIKINSNSDNAVDHLTVAKNRFVSPRLAVTCLADTNPIRAVDITDNQVDSPNTDVADVGVFRFGTSVNVSGNDAFEKVTGKGNHVKNAPYSVWYPSMLAGDTFGALILSDNFYYNTSTVASGSYAIVNNGGAGTYRLLAANNEIVLGNSNTRSYTQNALSFGSQVLNNIIESGLNGTANGLLRVPFRRQTVTYSASMTIDAAIGNEFDITANDGVAFTINAPTNPVDGHRITITIRNTAGGALGAATWDAVFKMAAWTQPASANSRSIDFRYDGTNWVEIGRTTADVPN